ncbi:MAG: hypothetical protein HY537_03855 [Deltaproteobacteria bacterium]|nr:hypothetical protein [Deltaproteobacteria bacterium]
MQLDLARLKGLTRGLMDVAQGRTKLASPESTRDTLARAKTHALAAKKSKKAMGG